MSNKEKTMQKLFSLIAPKYDLINQIISWGQIQRWRKKLVKLANPANDAIILDLCCGTGKLSFQLANKLTKGKVYGVDFCPQMIKIATANLTDKLKEKIVFRLGNACHIDFPDNYFDLLVIAFGLRNVIDKKKVMQEMRRVIKPEASVLCLDLGKREKTVFNSAYYLYFNHIVPLIGKAIHGQKEPYQYLVNSLKDYPNPQQLQQFFKDNGFKEVEYFETCQGIVVIHKAVK